MSRFRVPPAFRCASQSRSGWCGELWSMLKPMAMVMMLGVYALAPATARAEDGD
jgi:hypothetical protein